MRPRFGYALLFVDQEQTFTDLRTHIPSEVFEITKLVANIKLRRVENDVEDGLRSTRIMYQLVGEPYLVEVNVLGAGGMPRKIGHIQLGLCLNLRAKYETVDLT